MLRIWFSVASILGIGVTVSNDVSENGIAFDMIQFNHLDEITEKFWYIHARKTHSHTNWNGAPLRNALQLLIAHSISSLRLIYRSRKAIRRRSKMKINFSASSRWLCERNPTAEGGTKHSINKNRKYDKSKKSNANQTENKEEDEKERENEQKKTQAKRRIEEKCIFRFGLRSTNEVI